MTRPERLRLLQKLRDDVNAILNSLDKTLIPGAINWGELSCAETMWVFSNDSSEYYRVVIEEAACGSVHLIAAVREALAKTDWREHSIEISTEW